jgi:hypothetical protein
MLTILPIVADKLVVLTTLDYLVPYECHSLLSILVATLIGVDETIDNPARSLRSIRLMYAELGAVVTNQVLINHDPVL